MELDIIMSISPPTPTSFMHRADNLILFPLSTSGHDTWKERSLDEIRDALKAKTVVSMKRECGDFVDEYETNARMGSSASAPAGKGKAAVATVTSASNSGGSTHSAV